MNDKNYCKSFFLPGGATGVLLFHGFTATTFEVKALADKLHGEGLSVSAPLLPGHGTTPADLNLVKMEDWLDTAERALADLKSRCSDIFVGGESMGGLISLWMTAAHPEIKGIMLYAPAVENRKLWITPLLKHFVKYSRKRNSDDLFEWQGYPVNPVAGAAELYRLQRLVRKRMKDVSQPVIIFQGRNDQTVSPAGAEVVLAGVSSTDKELVWYDCGHCVLLEDDFEDAALRSVQFIRRIQDKGQAP